MINIGKSVPTYREELDKIISEWSKFKKALRKEERKYFMELMKNAKRHTSAAQYQANPDPMESLIISILLEHQKTLARLKRKLKDERMDIGYLSRLEKGEDDPLDEDEG